MSVRSRVHKVLRRHGSQIIILVVGAGVTAVVALSTQLGLPSDDGWRTALYVLLGVAVTLVVATTTDGVHRKIQGVQWEIRDFLMERVNSRNERTAAVIDLCRKASHEFCAVTFFPAVGIRDDPESAPGEYLHALEEALAKKEIRVTLVSVSCEEAREYCKQNSGFHPASYDALDWIGDRLKGLERRFPERLELIHVPGEAITVNVCHNESTALMYHMSMTNDDGAGFRSTDARIVAVAKGAFSRYMDYCRPMKAA